MITRNTFKMLSDWTFGHVPLQIPKALTHILHVFVQKLDFIEVQFPTIKKFEIKRVIL